MTPSGAEERGIVINFDGRGTYRILPNGGPAVVEVPADEREAIRQDIQRSRPSFATAPCCSCCTPVV